MSSIFSLVLFTVLTQFPAHKFDNVNSYRNRIIDYSDYDYELPPFWEEDLLRKKATAKQATKPANPGTTRRTTKAKIRDLSNTLFMSLESYQSQAVLIPEEKYPWIAKVVHATGSDFPYICTAVCIEPRIFITAGRCIYYLKVTITRVVYLKERLFAKAFVLPDKLTKQMFDDVGLIVVYDQRTFSQWRTVPLINVNRTDNEFQWFANLNYSDKVMNHKVIGYATKKFVHRNVNSRTEFLLSELKVYVDINMCELILSRGGTTPGYYVPCYHSCNRKEFMKRSPLCHKYHGTEGGAVLNFETNRLLGLATWSGSCENFAQSEIPVGFTVPNSENYFKDLTCARKIMGKAGRAEKGELQKLCGS